MRRSESYVCFVWQAFGQSFLQPDIHIFKQNLSYLEILNTKHKLYHRVRYALIVRIFGSCVRVCFAYPVCVCVCLCSEAIQELHALPLHQCAAASSPAQEPWSPAGWHHSGPLQHGCCRFPSFLFILPARVPQWLPRPWPSPTHNARPQLHTREGEHFSISVWRCVVWSLLWCCVVGVYDWIVTSPLTYSKSFVFV